MLTTVPVNVFKELLKKPVDETIFSDTDPFLPLIEKYYWTGTYET